MTNDKVKYFCDNKRHLVCVPYSVEALHDMAAVLGLKRCWFHNKKGRAHYDIPSRRIAEITSKCELVSPKEIIAIIEGTSWRTDVTFLNIVHEYEKPREDEALTIYTTVEGQEQMQKFLNELANK